MIMKKNGFTLIELLICIVILGVIATSISLNILNNIKKEEEKQLEMYMDTIEDAACTYAEINDLRDYCTNRSNCIVQDVTIDAIIKSGLLDENLKNPTNQDESLKGVIKIEWKDDEKICTYSLGN